MSVITHGLIFSVDISPFSPHASVREVDRFNLRSSELDERFVIPGRIESDGHVSSLVFIVKKTRRRRILLGSNAGFTTSTRKLHLPNSGAFRFGSGSPTDVG